jgi:cytochrome c
MRVEPETPSCRPEAARKAVARASVLSAAVLAALMALPSSGARAQMDLPTMVPATPDGATLFRNQCAACHTIAQGGPPGQGPNLFGVVGRKAGSVKGFAYSPGFAKVDFVWDEPHLDAWLTNPQAVIPNAIMMYSQAKPAVRHAIIVYLETRK